MEDIGLVKQGWKWLQSQKHLCSCVCAAMQCFVGKTEAFAVRHWPLVCSGCGKLLGLLSLSFLYWKDCVLRGFQSSAKFGSAALLLIMWSCFLSLTSVSCLVYVLLGMVRPPLDPSSVLNRVELSLLPVLSLQGAAGAVVVYLGCTPGIFIVGLFGILIMWMYANFWITGTLFIVAGKCQYTSFLYPVSILLLTFSTFFWNQVICSP